MDNAPIDTDAAHALWAEYRASAPAHWVEDEAPSIERFGDHPELTDELLDLVIHGPKRATAGLVAEFEAEGAPLPRVGSHWIACDSMGRPRVVLRSVELRVGPFTSVDERFAFDEGEGDRSLASWCEGHRDYWTRVGTALGIEWTDAHDIVFERFEVVWPPEHADARP
ncbi:ASCH domain-containing protein [Agromyces mediolanus]|uniref:ASCH domain-containing protein n=1 Tax=Agromyces mediolanus TaxID=41986 RepID=UPI00203C3797|nr:ASCH domain-containing protein [Agromyces mediolanus]MCM3657539.1 ASCH domain-containing protein [Agromyces mediolanus]